MTDQPQVLGDEIAAADARQATGALASFARACARHPWRVISVWLAVTALLAIGVVTLHGTLKNEFNLPGSDTQRAADILKAKFPAQNGSHLTFVVQAPAGQRIDSPQAKAAIAEITALAKRTQGVTSVVDPFAATSRQNISASGRTAFFDAAFSKTSFQLSRSTVTGLESAARAAAAKAGLQLEFTGDAENAPPQQGTGEILGILAALVILLILFRALVPTFIPVVFAIVSVATAFLILYLLARIFTFNTITPILVSMIGLGVGIDYTLFIVTRFRQLLHDGLTPAEAAAGAAATAGRAVIFAGVTVAISVAGLALIGMSFITAMGFGASLGVLTAVVLANTLLPSVLTLLGHRIDSWRLGLPQADESETGRDRTPIARWGKLVTRKPAIFLAASLAITLLMASPAIAVRLGLADAGTAPKDQTTRKAYDILSDPKDGFGPGFTAPLTVVLAGGSQSKSEIVKSFESLSPQDRLAAIAPEAAAIDPKLAASILKEAAAGGTPSPAMLQQAQQLLDSVPLPVLQSAGTRAAALRLFESFNAISGSGKPAAAAKPPIFNPKGDVAILNLYSNSKPQDAKTDDLVAQLRNSVIPATLAGTGTVAYVTGQNAAFTDIGHKIFANLPWFLLFVVGVTVLVMTMAFRSIVIAFKAALTTMLSAFVGFGVLVFVIQLGNGLSWTGLDRTGPIESFVPPIAFAILFGLSMDYEVFLMSRIREEHVHGRDTVTATTHGMAAVGRVILAAALVMGTVFYAFMLGPERGTKEFGLLLGTAILVDALVVRLTMVPAILALLGDRSWYIPKWLDRVLPHLTIEPPIMPAVDEPATTEPTVPAGV